MRTTNAQMTSPSPEIAPVKALSVLKIQARGEVICAFSHYRHSSRSVPRHKQPHHQHDFAAFRRDSGTAQPQRTTNLTYKRLPWHHEAASTLESAQSETPQSHTMHNEPHHSPKPDSSPALHSHNQPHPAALRHFSKHLSERRVGRFF